MHLLLAGDASEYPALAHDVSSSPAAARIHVTGYLDDASVDVVVSGLVLNFLPDQPSALAEMLRVTRDNGTIAAHVWDYAGKMEFLRAFWDAVVELDHAAAPADEGSRFPLCRPEALRTLLDSAGLANIEVSAIDIPTRFADFDDFWEPFLGGASHLHDVHRRVGQGSAARDASRSDPERHGWIHFSCCQDVGHLRDEVKAVE